MNLLDRAAAALGLTGPLKAADRPLWAAARTLPDLCELTAQWLEGRIASQPGYYGPVDVDEEDAPGLTDTLAALNRAGFLTYNSQAGFYGAGFDSARWRLHASVSGFATPATLRWIEKALSATATGLLVYTCRDVKRPGPGFPVTRRNGRPHTVFGAQYGRSVIGEIYADCSDEAIDEVCRTMHVTVYDPMPGRNTMWEPLRHAAVVNGGAR